MPPRFPLRASLLVLTVIVALAAGGVSFLRKPAPPRRVPCAETELESRLLGVAPDAAAELLGEPDWVAPPPSRLDTERERWGYRIVHFPSSEPAEVVLLVSAEGRVSEVRFFRHFKRFYPAS